MPACACALLPIILLFVDGTQVGCRSAWGVIRGWGLHHPSMIESRTRSAWAGLAITPVQSGGLAVWMLASAAIVGPVVVRACSHEGGVNWVSTSELQARLRNVRVVIAGDVLFRTSN